jgi:hypothetical protein
MRKIAILVGAVALLTMLFAGVALARNFQCSDRPCFGTNQGDVISERGGTLNDEIYGRRGADRINATEFGSDTDILYGGRGDDRLDARDGDGRDELWGGPGFDRCFGDTGDEYHGCEIFNGVVQ